MKMRPVRQDEAQRLLFELVKRLFAGETDLPQRLSESREDEVDRLCIALADDEDMSLEGVDPELKALLKARLIFAIQAAISDPDKTIISVSPGADDDLVTRALLGYSLSKTRPPSAGRHQ